MSEQDLLSPSLERARAEPIYSVGAQVAAAFFGGGLAVVMIAALNSKRLQRLSRDLVWLALGVACVVAVIAATAEAIEGNAAEEVRRGLRLASRAVGFALVGGYYFLHRRAYRTMSATGIDPPSPYLVVIAAVLLSVFATLGLAYLLGGYRV